jgi:Ca2+-transporting ATPase
MASPDIENGLKTNASSLKSPSGDNLTSLESIATKRQPSIGQEVTAQAILNDKEALAPDPGTEHLFEVENNKFAFSPGQLSKLLNPKSLSVFYALGGVVGLEKGLRSNVTSGLSSDEVSLDGTVSFEEATSVVSSTEKATAKGNGISRTSSDTKKASPSQSDGQFVDRKHVFADNRLPEKKSKSLLELAWITYND